MGVGGRGGGLSWFVSHSVSSLFSRLRNAPDLSLLVLVFFFLPSSILQLKKLISQRTYIWCSNKTIWGNNSAFVHSNSNIAVLCQSWFVFKKKECNKENKNVANRIILIVSPNLVH